MRWDLFDNAVKLARKFVHDEDAARDVALQALEEVGSAPESHVMQCVKRRAQDAVKAHVRQPFVANLDMDLLPSDDSVFETVARKQHDDKMLAALGSRSTYILRAVAEGFTNADIGRVLGVSEETARLWRNEAQLQRDIQGL